MQRPRLLTEQLRYFSLFSGIGGFELGIDKAYLRETPTGLFLRGRGNSPSGLCGDTRKWTTSPKNIGFSEIDKYATQIYKTHFNHKEYGDVSTINWSDTGNFDLLVGGFPCQAFSIAGKRRGFNDTRGTLFFEIARCLKEKQPRLLLLENVKGLLSHDKGRTFGTILNTLDELGYDLQWQVLNSKNFGVPQNRERVFIIGHLRGTSRPEVFPIRESSKSNLKYCGGVVSAREKWLDDGKSNSRNFSQGQRIYSTEGINQTLAGNAGGQGGKTGLYQIVDKKGKVKRKDYASTLQGGAHSGGNHSDMDLLLSKTIRFGGTNSPHDSRQNWDSYKIGNSIRRFTPTECERLQGFPDGWTEGISDTQRYKCLGNAVTVNVIEAIMTRIL